MDRDDSLRRAEKLLRQGRLDAAIEEYASVVAAYPKDWATANLLGDLFIRAGRIDRAVAQYARIAEQLAAEGFLSKSAALYKKIVKITPDDEQALLRTAELAAQQGLLADARHVLHTLFRRRVKAGDRDGAARIANRLPLLDPDDMVGRLDAARMLDEIGDAPGAADHLRLAGDTLAGQGREADALQAWRESMRLNPANTLAQERVTSALVSQGDLEGALASAQSVAERRAVATAMLKAGRDEAGLEVLGQVLDAEPDHVDTRLQLARMLMSRHQYPRARDLLKPGLQSGDARVELALAEADLRSGMTPAAVTILTHLLEKDPASVNHVAALGASLTDEQPDIAFVAVGCALDCLVGRGDLDWALKIVERFVTAAPRHVPALERFAQLCRDGLYEDTLYQVESELTEAYLVDRRFAEALPLAERLAALRPDVDRHAGQTREALAGMIELIPRASDRSGGDPSTTESIDLAEFAASLGLPVHRDSETEAGDELVMPPAVTDAEREPPPADEGIEIEWAEAGDAVATLPVVPDAERQPPSAHEVIEIELADARDAVAMPPIVADAEREPPPADEFLEIELAEAGIAVAMPPIVADAEREPRSTHEVIELESADARDTVAMPPIVADAAREPPPADQVIELELADALDALIGSDASGTVADGVERHVEPSRKEADSAGDLDDLFRRMREESGRAQVEADALRAYDDASVHYNEGRFDQAVACLRRAGRDPSLRFRATVMLARIATDRGQLDEAITWFERAAESPAPSVQAERSLLYELGVALERAGEPVRAQAVFLELSAMEPGYRDVAARLEALADGRANELPES